MMKYLLITLSGIIFSLSACSQATEKSAPSGNNEIALIPIPVSMKTSGDVFQLNSNLTIITDNNNADLKRIASQLSERIKIAAGFAPSVNQGNSPKANSILLSLSNDKSIHPEGYRLNVTKDGITLNASQPAGIFYGIQTLYQLLPKEILANKKTDANWSVPTVIIDDYPRFGWRGLMLDVARHFFTVDQVKQFIDDMVRYKFNLLHLHLSDDQGWRLEIKSLPKLTEVGAWRVEKTGNFGTFSNPSPDEPRTYGGFYTHDDIRELVKYASDRFVNIMPEIDVPGHSLAAIASYPELSCTPGKYSVNSGERFMIWPPGGHFYGILDNTLCPANEKVYEFMEKVWTEVAQLFPFDYIHMGGDETARNFWEKSDAIKAMMKKEKLKNLDEVQSYFVKRMEKIIRSKGKKMIGWDEILDGGLAPNAAVMSWRGMKGGVRSAKMGHEVVMAPTDFVYLDYMQGDRINEPPVYASLRLSKTYQFDPLPDSVDKKLIKGGQANLWTEQIYNTRHMQYMLWPRAFAVAECLWSPKESKEWNGFVKRVEKHFERHDVLNIKYAPSMYEAIIEVSRKDSTPVVKLSSEVNGIDLHYSFDNSYPDNYYPKYSEPVAVPKDASLMRIVSYRDGKQMGRIISMPVEELKKRAKIK